MPYININTWNLHVWYVLGIFLVTLRVFFGPYNYNTLWNKYSNTPILIDEETEAQVKWLTQGHIFSKWVIYSRFWAKQFDSRTCALNNWLHH